MKNIFVVLFLGCFSAAGQTQADLQRQIRDLERKVEDRQLSDDAERREIEAKRLAAEEERLLAIPLDPDIQKIAQSQFSEIYSNRKIDQRDKAGMVRRFRLQLARSQEARNLPK